MFELSGYQHNSLTTFFMKEKIPVILDQEIDQLEPAYFWGGGGRLALKIGVSIPDYKKYIGDRLIVDLISTPKSLEKIEANIKEGGLPIAAKVANGTQKKDNVEYID